MKERLHEILAMRDAHDAYRALLARVIGLTKKHPCGLQIKPLLGWWVRK